MENKKELNDIEIEKVSGGSGFSFNELLDDHEKKVFLSVVDLIRYNSKAYNEIMDCMNNKDFDEDEIKNRVGDILKKYVKEDF